MALIAIASDKGAPGVTTAALALAAVWPRPVLLAECDQAGGDLVYRFPAAGGGHLDPRRGVLSLAVVARRGMQPQQVWEHVQKLHGGLDVLAGVTNAEQGAGLSLLWGPIGKALAGLPQADVIADCGRLGADGPLYDLLVEATAVVLVSKVQVADVIRLRDRASAFAAAAQSRGRRGFGVGVVVVAEHKKFRAALGEVQHVLGQANTPATVLGGIAHDTKGADLLSGEWGGSLDRTMLIRTAREVAAQLVQSLPPIGDPAEAPPGYPAGAYAGPPAPAAPQAPGSHAAQSAPGAQQAPAAYAAAPVPPRPGRRHAAPSADASPATAFSSPPAAASYNGQQLSGPQPPRPSALAAVTLSAPPLAAPPLAAPPLAAPPASGPSLPGPVASGPTISPDAPRTTFSRVLGGRGGRHQADHGQDSHGQAGTPDQSDPAASQAGPPGPEHSAAYSVSQTGVTQAAVTQAAVTQTGVTQTGVTQTGLVQTRGARHAAPAAGRPGAPGFFRPPMPPLTPSAGPGDPGDPGPEDADSPDDSGWSAAPWRRQGPMGSTGSTGPARPGGE
jgi:hypothetical protein